MKRRVLTMAVLFLLTVFSVTVPVSAAPVQHDGADTSWWTAISRWVASVLGDLPAAGWCIDPNGVSSDQGVTPVAPSGDNGPCIDPWGVPVPCQREP